MQSVCLLMIVRAETVRRGKPSLLASSYRRLHIPTKALPTHDCYLNTDVPLCGGGVPTDFPFICLQRIFVFGLRTSVGKLHKVHPTEAGPEHSYPTEGRKQVMCTLFSGLHRPGHWLGTGELIYSSLIMHWLLHQDALKTWLVK